METKYKVVKDPVPKARPHSQCQKEAVHEVFEQFHNFTNKAKINDSKAIQGTIKSKQNPTIGQLQPNKEM